MSPKEQLPSISSEQSAQAKKQPATPHIPNDTQHQTSHDIPSTSTEVSTILHDTVPEIPLSQQIRNAEKQLKIAKQEKDRAYGSYHDRLGKKGFMRGLMQLPTVGRALKLLDNLPQSIITYNAHKEQLERLLQEQAAADEKRRAEIKEEVERKLAERTVKTDAPATASKDTKSEVVIFQGDMSARVKRKHMDAENEPAKKLPEKREYNPVIDTKPENAYAQAPNALAYLKRTPEGFTFVAYSQDMTEDDVITACVDKKIQGVRTHNENMLLDMQEMVRQLYKDPKGKGTKKLHGRKAVRKINEKEYQLRQFSPDKSGGMIARRDPQSNDMRIMYVISESRVKGEKSVVVIAHILPHSMADKLI